MNAGPRKIVIASGNAGKIREIAGILEEVNCEIIPQAALHIAAVPETGKTFVDNALIKARHAAQCSGLPAIADDSGLVVDALGGRPGVRSARYAGEDAGDDENLAKLLSELEGVPLNARTAHYECVAVWVSPDRSVAPLIARGEWHGVVIEERRGAGGFGYDPVFLDESTGKTGAEMSTVEKNLRSHRGKAFRRLRDLLLQAGR